MEGHISHAGRRQLKVAAGARIEGWTLVRPLGHGAMAEVWLAEGSRGEAVAIKWPTGEGRAPGMVAEIGALSRLDHAGIVKLVATGRTEGRTWFAMEWVEGMDLALLGERLRRRPVAERHVRARELGVQLADALSYLHSCGLVHRDVKPSNVLFGDGRGGPARAVLADFGVVAALDAPAGGSFIGSVAWAAPEALLGARVDARGEQYSFGLVLYWLLTGHRPFDEGRRSSPRAPPRPPSEQDPTVPADLETIVLRCLSFAPSRRFKDMAAVRDALRAVPPPRGTRVAGRQPAADRVAYALEHVAGGAGWVLRVVGAAGAGQDWLADIARTSATRRGLVVVVEDDPGLAAHVATRIREGEAILLLTAADVPADETLALAPLGVADLRRSIFAVAPQTPEIAAAAEQLRAWSGGHAALVEAALAHAVAGTLDLSTLPEPDITPWIGPLDLDALCVAQALAALPVGVSPDVLEAVAVAPAPESLGQLERLGLAESAGTRWMLAAEAFRAPLLALALDPIALQERAARALGTPLEDDPVLREARAHIEAGEPGAAIRELVNAVADAHDPGRSTAERRLLLAAIHWTLRDPAGASAQWIAVHREAADPRHRARAGIGLGVLHMQSGALGAAVTELTRALTDADLAGDARLAALATLDLAEVLGLRGQFPEALRAGKRAREEARSLRDRALEAKTARALGQVYVDLGLWREAEAVLADASALARAAGLQDERLAAHTLRAQVALDARPGDRTAAAVALDRLLDAGAAPDPEGWGTLVDAIRAECYACLGEAERAREALERAMHSTPPAPTRVRSDLRIARVHAVLGQPVAAREAWVRAERCATQAGFTRLAWQAACELASVDGTPAPELGAWGGGVPAGPGFPRPTPST